ncbi:hypothetical protein BBP00_00004970, partial [Phytophthora kernoviae]
TTTGGSVATRSLAFSGECGSYSLTQSDESFKASVNGGSCMASSNGASYSMAQFYLHAPSEHTLNGKPLDGEVHFVHTNADGSALMVVGMFLQVSSGETDPWMASLLNGMEAVTPANSTTLNLGSYAGLVDANANRLYNYPGSLTTPACDEIVDWWVVQKPVKMSSKDFARLQTQLKELHVTDNGNNARPVQPLNGHVGFVIPTTVAEALTQQWFSANLNDNETQLAVGVDSDLKNLSSSDIICNGVPSLQSRSTETLPNFGCPDIFTAVGGSCTCLDVGYNNTDTWEFHVTQRGEDSEHPKSLCSDDVLPIDTVRTIRIIGEGDSPQGIRFASEDRRIPGSILPIAVSTDPISVSTVEITNIDMYSLTLSASTFLPPTTTSLTLRNCNIYGFGFHFFDGVDNLQYMSGGETIEFQSAETNSTHVLLNDPVIVTNRINHKEIKLGKCLSRGGFGLVFVGEYKNRQVAVKKIRPERSQDPNDVKAFLKEIILMAELHHPRIVEFIGVAWDNLKHLSAVSEFMEGGDLRYVLRSFKRQGRPLSWKNHKMTISLHIAEALEYLHTNKPKVIHRDLKSKNVLLNMHLEAKLTDFGVSRTQYTMQTHTMTAGIGTSFWIAPEVLLGRDYNEQADIYSFGVVLSEIDTDDYPYWNDSNRDQARASPLRHVNNLVVDGIAVATKERLENIDLSSVVLSAGYFFPSTTLNLTLRNCNLEKFGYDFFQGLNSVEYLYAKRSDLSENKLITAYAGNSIGKTCTTQFCAVQILNLTGNELTSFPSVVFNLDSLAELYIRDNNFTDFNVSASREVDRALLDDPVIVTNRIKYKQLKLGKCISQGGFGLVFMGEYRGHRVAIKKIRPDRNDDVSEIEVFLKEITIMAVLYHPRIVEFIGVAWDSLRHLAAVTEYMDNGDLRNVLYSFKKRGSPLSWETHKASISLHIAEALSYLHSLHPKVIHRDLKSKNVLLNLHFEAKLSDFGISRMRYDIETHMTAGVGTSFWIAPEIILSRDYDERADIYSFGVVLAEIDTDDYPYWNDNNPNSARGRIQEAEILSQVAAGKMQPKFSSDCPVEILVLADACLQRDPRYRPNALEIVTALQGFIHPSRKSSSQYISDDLESIWSVQSPSNIIL